MLCILHTLVGVARVAQGASGGKGRVLTTLMQSLVGTAIGRHRCFLSKSADDLQVCFSGRVRPRTSGVRRKGERSGEVLVLPGMECDELKGLMKSDDDEVQDKSTRVILNAVRLLLKHRSCAPKDAVAACLRVSEKASWRATTAKSEAVQRRT